MRRTGGIVARAHLSMQRPIGSPATGNGDHGARRVGDREDVAGGPVSQCCELALDGQEHAAAVTRLGRVELQLVCGDRSSERGIPGDRRDLHAKLAFAPLFERRQHALAGFQLVTDRIAHALAHVQRERDEDRGQHASHHDQRRDRCADDESRRRRPRHQ